MIDTLIKTLRELKQYCSSKEFDLNEFTVMLKEYEKEYGMSSVDLLELLYNKDFLKRKVAYKTQAFDDTIKNLKKQISKIEDQKYQYGSLICDLHGHDLEMTEEYDSKNGHVYFCTNCGKTMYLEEYKANAYLRLEEQSKSKIYKYKDNN